MRGSSGALHQPDEDLLGITSNGPNMLDYSSNVTLSFDNACSLLKKKDLKKSY